MRRTVSAVALARPVYRIPRLHAIRIGDEHTIGET
jgi:hypothetical protein